MISNSPYLINSKSILISGLLCLTLASFNINKNTWVAEKGSHTILIGSSSLDIQKQIVFSQNNVLIAEKTHAEWALNVPFTDLKI
ncbi:hypothetical protein V8G61_12155 [Gaetbulibacter sp. M240]|uniref:hypothetical protein n=1 Tax=Gaetbulibacter sp. M240 TaxID=3126511 RepID=UPI00374F66BE